MNHLYYYTYNDKRRPHTNPTCVCSRNTLAPVHHGLLSSALMMALTHLCQRLFMKEKYFRLKIEVEKTQYK